MMKDHCLLPCLLQEHERYYPTPPHPSSNWWWKTTACCRACVCTGTWTLLSHPTPPHPSSNWWWKTTACCRACVYRNMNVIIPPHPTPAVIRMFGNLTAASDRFIRSDKSFTAASGAVLLPQVTGKSHCRKWSKLTVASEGWASFAVSWLYPPLYPNT